jgi:hypothetical protein
MTIEELLKLSADLMLIGQVKPNYGRGRRRELSDEETEERAHAAFVQAENYIGDEIERLSKSKGCWQCRNIESHDIDYVTEVSDKVGRQIAVEMPLNFCPSCGRRLEKGQ